MLKALRTSGPQSANELAAALANRGRAIRPDTIQVALGEFVAAELVAGAGEDGQQRWLALPTARDPLLEAVDLHGAHDFRQRTKRYFREPPGRRRTHVHVRPGGQLL